MCHLFLFILFYFFTSLSFPSPVPMYYFCVIYLLTLVCVLVCLLAIVKCLFTCLSCAALMSFFCLFAHLIVCLLFVYLEWIVCLLDNVLVCVRVCLYNCLYSCLYAHLPNAFGYNLLTWFLCFLPDRLPVSQSVGLLVGLVLCLFVSLFVFFLSFHSYFVLRIVLSICLLHFDFCIDDSAILDILLFFPTRRYLQNACKYWSKQGKLTNTLSKSLLSHIDSDHTKVSLDYIDNNYIVIRGLFNVAVTGNGFPIFLVRGLC